MSIKRKVVLILNSIFLLSGLVNIIVQQNLIMPGFVELAKETAIKNAECALGQLTMNARAMPSILDWSSWTDTYNYVRGKAEI